MKISGDWQRLADGGSGLRPGTLVADSRAGGSVDEFWMRQKMKA